MTNVFRFSFIAGLLSVGAAFMGFASGSPVHAQSTDKGTDTILVLDASGSMWGVVDGQTKISAARQAVNSILSKWRPEDRLGLIAYGHRSKGDCKDIELLVPVSTFDPAKIKTAVDALNPKGKTPIADSLRAAAAALRSTENKATVILVSDGIETCAPDPCAVAAELKKSGVDFHGVHALVDAKTMHAVEGGPGYQPGDVVSVRDRSDTACDHEQARRRHAQ